MKADKTYRMLTAALFLLLATQFYFTPYSGDDLSYTGVFSGASAQLPWWSLPRFAASHWLHANGRLANLIMPLCAFIPKWVVAPLFAAAMVWLFRGADRLANPARNPWLTPVVWLTLIAALPWWDSLCLFDCQLNYVWTSAMILTALRLITSPPSTGWRPASAALCFLAACMHESASLPLLCGLTAWLLLTRRRPESPLLFCAFAAGTLLVTLSPGILLRAGGERIADDPLPLLMLKSDLLPVVLWAAIAVCAFTPGGRRRIVRLMTTPDGALAIAALISAAIGLWSGIVGRSGWFAQLFALMVLLRHLLPHLKAPAARTAGLLSAAAVMLYFSFLAAMQVKLGREHDLMVELYRRSTDGVVFMDYTRDSDLPYWVLGRTRGVPDPDDVYLLHCLALYYHPQAPHPVVLPAEARLHLPLASGSSVTLSNGDLLTTRIPGDAVSTYMPREQLSVSLTEIDGRQWVAQQVNDSTFHLSPRMIDPGDR